MNAFIGVLLFIVLAFLSGLHFYWAFGGKWASEATVPVNAKNEKVLRPNFIACLMVGLGLLATGIFILIKVSLIHFNLWGWISNYGLWLIAAVFILRAIGDFKYAGFFKKIKHSTFAAKDTKYYSPLCLALGVLIIAVALNK